MVHRPILWKRTINDCGAQVAAVSGRNIGVRGALPSAGVWISPLPGEWRSSPRAESRLVRCHNEDDRRDPPVDRRSATQPGNARCARSAATPTRSKTEEMTARHLALDENRLSASEVRLATNGNRGVGTPRGSAGTWIRGDKSDADGAAWARS
jgi:hypothetical protein